MKLFNRISSKIIIGLASFVILISIGFSGSFWKTQNLKGNNNQTFEPEKATVLPIQQGEQDTIPYGTENAHDVDRNPDNQTPVGGNIKVEQKPVSQSQGMSEPPIVVERLCLSKSEQEFVTQDGQQYIFHKSAAFLKRCDDGKVWVVVEDGSKVPDVATFYFDENGILLDICQPLFWRSGCVRFKNISCEQRNYCEDG